MVAIIYAKEVTGRYQVKTPYRVKNMAVQGSAGAVFIEFAIIVPVLILILIGIVNLGIALAQIHNFQRVVYEGANYGSSVPAIGSSSAQSKITLFLNRMMSLPDQASNTDSSLPPNMSISYNTTSGPNLPPENSVTVSSQGTMQLLFGIGLPFRVTNVTPYYLTGSAGGFNFQTFQNPVPLVDCNGHLTGCPDRSCGSTMPCPP